MSTDNYQGWTNYETWAVNLWMSNDQSTQEYWQEQTGSISRSSEATDVWTKAESAKFNLADAIKAKFEDANPLNDSPSVYSDLLNAALSQVNWREIAEHLLETD